MAAYRTGYNTGTYGVRAFGVDGTVTDAISTTASTASSASTAEIIYLASATVTGSATASADSVYVVDASASTSASSSTTSSAEIIYLGDATVTAGVTSASASIQFITNATPDPVTASAVLTSAGVRVPEGSATVTSAATFDAQAFITAKGVSGIAGAATTADLDGVGYRVRESSANTVQGVSTIASVDGREKWEPISYTSITWSNVA